MSAADRCRVTVARRTGRQKRHCVGADGEYHPAPLKIVLSGTECDVLLFSLPGMNDTDSLLHELRETLESFESSSRTEDLRNRVRGLVPAFETLRSLGKSLVPNGLTMSARDRLLAYFREYPRVTLSEKELALVAGISEWARRVRELRVQFGWKIITGMAASEMLQENEIDDVHVDISEMGPNDYVLVDERQDRDAAYRWNVANEIRKTDLSMQDRILEYLRRNVGNAVTGEELRYVAKGSEWARRVRELRTEHGWPITTKTSGNPSLAVGVYVLEQDRQTPPHDRNVPDHIRREVLRRDDYRCRNPKCGWTHEEWNRSDPRFLEVHHIVHHAHGGKSELENLVTFCNICHDRLHAVDTHR